MGDFNLVSGKTYKPYVQRWRQKTIGGEKFKSHTGQNMISHENGDIINNVTSPNFTAMKTRAPVCSTPSQSDRVEC